MTETDVDPAPTPPTGPSREEVGHRVVRNSLFSLLSFGINLPVMFLMVPFLLDRLGPEVFGIWSVASSLLMVSDIFYIGTIPAIVKYIAEHAGRSDPEGVNRIVASTSTVFLGLAIPISLAVLAGRAPLARGLFGQLAPALFPTAEAVLSAMVLVFLARFPLAGYSLVLVGLQRHDVSQIINLLNNLLFAGGAVVLLLRGGTVTGLMLWSAATNLLALVLFVWAAHRIYRPLSVRLGRFDGDTWNRLVRFGLRVVPLNVSSGVHQHGDKLILSAVHGASIAGLYGIATSLVIKMAAIPSNVLGPMMSAVSDLEARGEAGMLQGLYRRAQRYNWIMVTLMYGGALALGESLVRVWLEGDRPLVVPVLQLLSLGVGFLGLAVPATHFLSGTGRPGVMTAVTATGATLHLVVAAMLALLVGPLAVASGTAVVLAAEAAWLLVRFHRSTGYPVSETVPAESPGILGSWLLAAAIGGWIAAPATRADPLPFLVGGVCYVALYGFGLVATGSLDHRDLRTLRRFLGRAGGDRS